MEDRNNINQATTKTHWDGRSKRSIRVASDINCEKAHRRSFPHEFESENDSSCTEKRSSVDSSSGVDVISFLPKELALYILDKLEAKDLLNVSKTCRKWRILAEDDVLWRTKSRRFGFHDERSVFRCPVSLDGFQRSLWKLNFIRQERILQNWRNGSGRLPRIIPAHDGHLITCLLWVDNDRVITGSDDRLLRVWSIASGLCLFTLEGHTEGVWAAEVEGSLLVSGSVDQTVRTWNLEDGTHIATFKGHTSTVRGLALKNGVCISASRDRTLRIWHVGMESTFSTVKRTTVQCQHGSSLDGHRDSVRCVRYDGVVVVSGSYDHEVRVWDPVALRCLHVLSGHTGRVYTIQFDGVDIVSGSVDTTLRVWDVKSGMLKHVLAGHGSLASGMHQSGHIMASGNADATVRLWDLRSGICLQTLGSDDVKHEGGVIGVHFDERFIVTGSDDGTVKLWEFATGAFIRDVVKLPPDRAVWKMVVHRTKLICAVGVRVQQGQMIMRGSPELLFYDFETPSLP